MPFNVKLKFEVGDTILPIHFGSNFKGDVNHLSIDHGYRRMGYSKVLHCGTTHVHIKSLETGLTKEVYIWRCEDATYNREPDWEV